MAWNRKQHANPLVIFPERTRLRTAFRNAFAERSSISSPVAREFP